MTLNYRGLKYDTNAVAAQTKPNKGVYRGVAVDLSSGAADGDRGHGTLKYRGAAYAV